MPATDYYIDCKLLTHTRFMYQSLIYHVCVINKQMIQKIRETRSVCMEKYKCKNVCVFLSVFITTNKSNTFKTALGSMY